MKKQVREFSEKYLFDPDICDHIKAALKTHEVTLEFIDDSLVYTSLTGSFLSAPRFSSAEESMASILLPSEDLIIATWEWIQGKSNSKNLEIEFSIWLLKHDQGSAWKKFNSKYAADVMANILGSKADA